LHLILQKAQKKGMGRTMYFAQKNKVFFVIFHWRGPFPKGVVLFPEE
jgi:hypothetical protein